MGTYLIERHFGAAGPKDLAAAGERSAAALAGEFAGRARWIRSHAVQADDGPVTYCLYEAESEDVIRQHAAAAELPCDVVSPAQVVEAPVA